MKTKLILVVMAVFFQANTAIAQNKQLEINQLNCSQSKEISSDSYRALAKKTNKSEKDFRFLRTEWKGERCLAVMDTPSGIAYCTAADIYVTSKGVKFLFLTSTNGSLLYCF